ncbi:MAG TPA: glycosyltransferase [Candidatus Sulfotelmatobacter sp.]|nr:glycosyltransferase [Candidatus Sulfotelmatobacter sp.]
MTLSIQKSKVDYASSTGTNVHAHASSPKPNLPANSDAVALLQSAGLWLPGKPLKLHLGCGRQYFEGYINIDYPPDQHNIMTVRADAFANITQLHFGAGSVDEVRLHHVFEHFNRVTALAMLIRWHQWLKSGGNLRIETPDLAGSARTLAGNSSYQIKMAAARHLAGDQAAGWAYHLDHWFPERYERTLSKLGFDNIEIKSSTWPHAPFVANVEVIAVKNRSLPIDQLLDAADELLWDSALAEAERPTFEIWRKQLRAILAGDGLANPGNLPAQDAATNADAVFAALKLNASTLPLDEIQNFNQRCRDRWVQEKAAIVAPGLRVLDVGAGTCPYRRFFSHCEYRTHDFKKYEGIKLGNTKDYGQIDYESDITRIPVADQSFDVVLCTEVLEHVPEPIEAVREMARILRPGGRLFLTAPLGSGLHQLPFHFYGGYTPEWYRYAGQKFSLEIAEISPNGGYFKLLAQECGRLAWTMPEHRGLHGSNAELIRSLFGEWLPRYLFGLEDQKLIDQFTVGYHVALVKNGKPEAPSHAPELASRDIPNKVVVKLQGGLGNQMFQYAAGLALARRTKSQLILDLSFLLDRSPRPDFTYRDFDLPIFKLAPDCHVMRNGAAYKKELRCVAEKHFHFDPEIERLGANVYLDGYWQSPRYFESALDEVRQSFEFVSEIGPEARAVLTAIQNCESVCLNVRRADFISNPRTRAIHGLCGEAYFQAAVRRIAGKIKSPHFFIFSDDIEWCRRANLVGNMPCTFVPHNLAGPRFATYLQLMKSCKHFILPNSTFGWWAAFLNESRNKIVIVPKPWFSDPNINTADLIPAGWETLEKQDQPVKPMGPDSLVSVIIPCYNQAQFLAEAVESVIHQTFSHWEVIVVNDGSPDNTGDVFQNLARRWPGHILRYLEKPNGGLADARNAGIAIARGKYILPLDADDKLHPEMLSKTVSLVESTPDIAIAYTDLVHFGARNGVVQAAEYDFAAICENNRLNYCSLYRREAWEAVGGYHTNMLWGYEDWDFWIGCGERGFKAKRIPVPLLFYRIKDSSMYTAAVQHDKELRAQIVLNHPGLYGPEVVAAAISFIGEAGLTPPAGAARRVQPSMPGRNGKPAAPTVSGRGTVFPESQLAHHYLDGLEGLEIGGSSHNPFGLKTKNVDYTADMTTVYKEEEIKMCGRPLGVDIVAPGDALPVADASQDFVISSHVIEHFFDPIKAIKEWLRVVRPGGYIFIIAPHKERTFDKERSRTTLAELLDRHSGKIPPPSIDTHHHYTVWTTEDLLELCRHLDWNVVASQDMDDKVGNGFTVVIQKATQDVCLEKSGACPAGADPKPLEAEPPLISVIVPTFNRTEMLVETLRSILNQTFRNFEIIVVNDAGCDVEPAVAQLGNQPIICLRHETNRGVPAARNTGLRAARGKYVAYLDDDDLYYPEHLQTLLNYLEAHPGAAAYTDACCSHQELVNGQWTVVRRDVPYSHDWDNDRVLVENFVPTLCFMHEKAFLEKAGYFDETLRRHEDWDLWIRLSRHFPFAHIPQVTCEFLRRNDASSMTMQSLAPFLETMKRIHSAYAGLISNRPDIEECQKAKQDDLQELAQNQSKTPKFALGVLTIDPKDTACAYLRLTAPLQRLQDCHEIISLAVCDLVNGKLKIDPRLLCAARVLVVQRGMAAILPYQTLRQAIPNPAVKIIFELDDALTLIPRNHQGYQYFKSLTPRIEDYLKNADMVTVSTPKLKQLYSYFNENIGVLPNTVDTGVWLAPERKRARTDKLSILFSGTVTHEHDLALIEKAIERIIQEFPERVEFMFWGNAPATLKHYSQVKTVSSFVQKYSDYARQLKSLSVDLALVPLELTPFNRAKSPIKWLEYSACRIPAIFTNIEAYNQIVEHEKTGWLVPNTTEAWYEAMKTLIQDDALRLSIAANAHRKVMSGCTLRQNAKLWLQVYEKALSSPPRKAMNRAPQVSVIIPTFNNLALTRNCISSILSDTPQGFFEIVVVDNGSTDGTPAWLKREEEAGLLRAILQSNNTGFARGCNIGAQAAACPLLVFLNNDTQVTEGWLAALVKTAQQSKAGAVGAKLLYADGTIQHAGIEFINGIPDHPYRHASADLPAANRQRELDMVTGACLMTPRDLFLSLGGFDEIFRNGVEDIDYCLRVRASCRTVVYEPQAVVYHLEGQSRGRFDHVNENLKIFFERWKGTFDKNFSFIVPPSPKTIPSARSLLVVDTSRPCADKPITVSWEGSFLDNGSLSHVNRELVASLQNSPGLKIHREPCRADVTVRHAWPPNWRRPATGKLAVIQPWEFGSLPQEWVTRAGDVDEFWVPSRYVRDVYVASGVAAHKVVVVPNGVNAEKFNLQAVPMKLATQKKFRFLFVGGTIGRKGPDLLLQAYLKQFTGADDVCLVIKDFGGDSVYAGQTFESQIRAVQSAAGAPEILYLNEELSPDSLPGLYAACDCLVLPYRGEGFGLPVLEAMACGLPVIVTAGGATDDFVRDEFAWRISASRKVFGREVSGMKLANDGWLLEPDLAALGESMRRAFTNPAESRERGQRAATYAREHWSWKKSASIVADRIRHLAGPQKKQSISLTSQDATKSAIVAPVAHIGRLNESRELFGNKKLEAAWNATLGAIAKRPFHPEAFLLLGEIAGAAGDGSTARQCAQHARSLAPDWSRAKQFLNRPLKGGAKPDWMKLPDAVQNSRTRTESLSVCLIVKNEERFLAQCLKSVRDIAQQIVVVDTGSTDRTLEIAKEFGAEIFAHEWSDDFSAARNAALEHATGDWVLMLDADEELPAAQHAKLLADIKNAGVMAYRLPLVNSGREAEGKSFVPRLFRNAPGARYAGRIHEQVFPSLLPLCKSWGLKTAMGTAQILHHGYNKEMLSDRNKIERNLKLLRRACEESPGDVNLAMNLGLELVRSENVTEGLEKYREAFQLMSELPSADLAPELREVLLTQFTSHLYKVRRHEEVVELLNSTLAKSGGLTASLHLALGLSQFELKNYAEAAEQMRQCLAKRHYPALSPINTDILTAMPNHCMALALGKINDVNGAEKAFQAALAETGKIENVKLDYAKFLAGTNRPVEALKKLHECVAANCGNAALWRAGGEIALSCPDFLKFAVDWTGEAMRYVGNDPVIVMQRAETLMLSGDTAAAANLWEQIWNKAQQPRALAALILCQAVDSQITYGPDDGAQEAAASREFIFWYQRLLVMRANTVANGINEQLDKLSRTLPTAAKRIEIALAGVQKKEELVS